MTPASDQGDSARRELERALGEIEKLPRKKRQPTRFHARTILLPLGRILIEGGDEVAREALKRLARAVEPFRESWEQAVHDELTLSCAEHVQGVDPRHLDHPRFDFEYVVSARERLEARLAAASALDLSPPEATLDQVSAADRLLEPFLRGDGSPRN